MVRRLRRGKKGRAFFHLSGPNPETCVYLSVLVVEGQSQCIYPLLTSLLIFPRLTLPRSRLSVSDGAFPSS